MIRTRVGIVVATAAAGLLALSACGVKETISGSPQPVAAQQQAQPAAQQQQQPQPAEPRAAEAKLAVAEVGSLGPVVTDQNGRTLYRFDKDKAKPPTSNCNGDCAKTWPPFTVQDLGEVQLSNVDKRLVGTVARADGTKQLTLGGWPLYRYTGDRAAGDAKGQGVGGTWFASTPLGKKAEAAAAVPDAGGGY
jgi:predicted lipoprotein with Yx(FWY)xxD motif